VSLLGRVPIRLRLTLAVAAGMAVVLAGLGVFLYVGAGAEAQAALRRRLLVGVPVAVLLASLLGYRLAAAALRPVDRLKAALARERRLVSDASHELRTPLAMLRTELELALRRPRPPEELQQALRSAAEETERLSRLAEDLLVLARADDHGLPIRRERLPAAELLTAMWERYAQQAADAGRPLEVRADDQLELDVDRLRAEQALGNLVENALRHGRGRVLLLAHRRDGRVELHVRDEGPGFPEAFLDRAFDRFSRSDPARQDPGAGLGLAIVDVIARAHGGTAHAANHDGGGDAWLQLPSADGSVSGRGGSPSR
jgi:two-component system, OmpR family, sensor kinase